MEGVYQELEYYTQQYCGSMQDVITQPGTNSTSQQAFANQATLTYVEGTDTEVLLQPVSSSLHLEPIPLNSKFTLRTSESQEPLYPLNRVLSVEIPVPAWLQTVEHGETTLMVELWIEPSEVSEAQFNDPSDWILTFNTNNLYTKLLPVVSHFFAGNEVQNYPARWLILLAGWLGPIVDRPKYLTLTASFRCKQLTGNYVDWRVFESIETTRTAIRPPAPPASTFTVFSASVEETPDEPPVESSYVVVE